MAEAAQPADEPVRSSVFTVEVVNTSTAVQYWFSKGRKFGTDFKCMECGEKAATPAALHDHLVNTPHKDMRDALQIDLEAIRPYVEPGSLGVRIARQYFAKQRWSDGTYVLWASSDYYDRDLTELIPKLNMTDSDETVVCSDGCALCLRTKTLSELNLMTFKERMRYVNVAHHPFFRIGSGGSCWEKSSARVAAYALARYLRKVPGGTVRKFMCCPAFNKVLVAAAFCYTPCSMYGGSTK